MFYMDGWGTKSVRSSQYIPLADSVSACFIACDKSNHSGTLIALCSHLDMTYGGH